MSTMWKESVSRLEGGWGWGLFGWPVATGVNGGTGQLPAHSQAGKLWGLEPPFGRDIPPSCFILET